MMPPRLSRRLLTFLLGACHALGRFGEPDGSFFARTGAIYKIASPGAGQGQQDYKNNQNLAAGRWHSYEIEVNNQDYIVRLKRARSFRETPGRFLSRYRRP